MQDCCKLNYKLQSSLNKKPNLKTNFKIFNTSPIDYNISRIKNKHLGLNYAISIFKSLFKKKTERNSEQKNII